MKLNGPRTHQGLERRVILEVVVQISVGHHPVHLDAEMETAGWVGAHTWLHRSTF